MRTEKLEWNTVQGMELIEGKWKYWSYSTKGIEEKGVVVEDKGLYYRVEVFAHDKMAKFNLPCGAYKEAEFEGVYKIAEYYNKDPENFMIGLEGQKRYNDVERIVNAQRTTDNWKN